MKRLLWGVSVAAIALSILGQPAYAEIFASPESITLAGNRNNQIPITIMLSSDEAIDQLNIRISDLRRADGAATIPASSILIDPTDTSLAENSPPEQITVTVNFADASANGEFTGSLLLYHANGREVIPITARIKTDPFWPWFTMLAGVGLGTWLSFYRASVKPRDEIVIQVGRLRNQMQADNQLDNDFCASIEASLIDVDSALEEKEWAAAKEKASDAKQLWNRWRKGREDWMAQLSYRDELAQEVNILTSTNELYTQRVKVNWENIQRRLRQGVYQTPQDLSDDFSDIRSQVAQFKEGQNLIETLELIVREIRNSDFTQESLWLNKVENMKTSFYHLQPGSEAGQSFQDWKQSAQDLMAEMEKALEKIQADQGQRALIITGRSGAISPDANSLLPPVPGVTTQSFTPEEVQQSQVRYNLFNQVARAVAISALAWAGMTEIYASNPTFGADPMRDYFALLAWGFGAEVTRESVIRAARDLDVPLNG